MQDGNQATHPQELLQDIIRGSGAIRIIQIHVFNARFNKRASIIMALVQSNHHRDTNRFEDGHVIVWPKRETATRQGLRIIKGP